MKNLALHQFNVVRLGVNEMCCIEDVNELTVIEQRLTVGGTERPTVDTDLFYDAGYLFGKIIRSIVSYART
jgi:hypothetical protein